jgi:hypothetical protein
MHNLYLFSQILFENCLIIFQWNWMHCYRFSFIYTLFNDAVISRNNTISNGGMVRKCWIGMNVKGSDRGRNCAEILECTKTDWGTPQSGESIFGRFSNRAHIVRYCFSQFLGILFLLILLLLLLLLLLLPLLTKITTINTLSVGR